MTGKNLLLAEIGKTKNTLWLIWLRNELV